MEKLGKPKKFNFVELGPGDGSLTNVLLEALKKFPSLNNSINIFLYEKVIFNKNSKKKIKKFRVQWIKNFNKIISGPVIFW